MFVKMLYEKLVELYIICEFDNEGYVLFYIDCLILNEYISLQVFSGLRECGCVVWYFDMFLLNIDYVNFMWL